MMDDHNTLELSVLLIEEDGGWWSAQCLEYDIAAQAKSLVDIRHEFEKMVVAHLLISHERNLEPFAGIDAAPKELWEEFDKASVSVSVDNGQISLPFSDAARTSPRFRAVRAQTL